MCVCFYLKNEAVIDLGEHRWVVVDVRYGHCHLDSRG